MKIAAFIPIRENSTRVIRKSFRLINNKRLFEYICDSAIDAECFDSIYVDTDSEEIRNYCHNRDIKTIVRDQKYLANDTNGNDLIIHHASLRPDYDIYFQLFATAPMLKPETIQDCVESLKLSDEYDSVFTATKESGWFWFGNQPVNFRPVILPRSQDATQVVKESTGLYGVTKKSLDRYNCRIGAKPIIKLVSQLEAIDLDTEEDFRYLEWRLLNG